MSAIDVEALLTIVRNHGNRPTQLLQILREVQDRFRHVPHWAIEQISEVMGVPRTQIQGVAEFYSFLSLEPQGRFHILLSDSISDHLLGSRELGAYLCERLRVQPNETRNDGRVSFAYTSCTGLCDQGPAGLVNGQWLAQLDRAKVDRIVELVETDVPLSSWPAELFGVADNVRRTGLLLDNPVVPGSALRASLQRGLEATFAELEKSGLRGRGGAGFQTAWKWKFCFEGPEELAVCPTDKGQQTVERYVVCNADEGEPGTFKDRMLLHSHAHQVFEGMTLCADIVGARQGFLYLRGEYLALRPTLEAVLAERRTAGLLGNGILGRPDFDFDIEIHMGAGAYICGEESALIESLEGKRGVPRNRPPYPVTHGYLGRPTVVNNVETFAAAAAIGLKGGDWFAAHGTEKAKGSKLLSICGDCERPGIYEYDFGVSLAEILRDCGARDPLGIQVGGPSGVFVSAREFDRKLAFEDLATGGSFMIFDQSRDILAIARNFTQFFAHESCGFCTPCRVGTSLLSNTLDKICDGHGTPHDLVELTKLGKLVKGASHCGLGQTAANPVLSTLERFPELYESRLKTISFEPGFDLDGALATARRLSGRDDALAHLEQEGL
ncbi:NAD(P)H-dependent oxidoreductase subunit E [Methylococcus sp. EFPC2]|uniref:NAD(P)H-dependent oxidoreductase subunit E n=1 Tax=Methylococcus sp. EFPC2 TaxID=2812648 RepID=UPI0019689F86|nr:NAD(P)H-dependent oxidoreductase subunit E [Methylococcus sp. EFPC2]QSA98787.1 NAD(P)H-dependent oxidoreductase subunit E [Methylococcus sp. EFPC2]